MTTQAGDDPTDASNAIASDIEAEMIWTSAGSPPEVTLSFQGLAEPISLWQQLMALGWGVPPCPPRPGSAIEWVPDPVAGTDYTIRPWRVNEFRLQEGQWSREVAPTIGASTYRMLRQFGATITGTQSQLDQLRSLEPAATTASPDTQPPPGAVQHAAVFLEMADDIAAQFDPVLTNWTAEIGRTKTKVRWSELHPSPGLRSDEFEMLVTASSGSWVLAGDLPPTGPGEIAFRMLLPGGQSNDSKLAKVVKQLGGMVSLQDLEPVVAEAAPAVLIFGAVPANAHQMLHSNLRLRVPTGAIRVSQ